MNERVFEYLDRIKETYKQKNLDYGDSWAESIREFGAVSGLVRIYDKYNRIKHLLSLPESERQIKDETIMDTLLDLATYAVMLAGEITEPTKPIDKVQLYQDNETTE